MFGYCGNGVYFVSSTYLYVLHHICEARLYVKEYNFQFSNALKIQSFSNTFWSSAPQLGLYLASVITAITGCRVTLDRPQKTRRAGCHTLTGRRTVGGRPQNGLMPFYEGAEATCA